MADFTQTATVKTAVRELAAPIDSMAAFTSIIDDILTNNPWGCTSYEQAGVTLPGVSKASESYTGRVIYENNEAKTVGTISIKAPTPSAFNTDVGTIVATTALNTAMGGTPSHDSSEDFDLHPYAITPTVRFTRSGLPVIPSPSHPMRLMPS